MTLNQLATIVASRTRLTLTPPLFLATSGQIDNRDSGALASLAALVWTAVEGAQLAVVAGLAGALAVLIALVGRLVQKALVVSDG